MRPVVQATIFSGRWHCVHEVIDALMALDYPKLDRLWLENGQTRLDEMFWRVPLPKVHHTGDPVYPQMAPDGKVRSRKKRAIAVSWGKLIKLAGCERDLMFIEDDIVAPPDTVRKLQETAYARPAGMVSALAKTNNGGWPFFFTDSKGRFVPVQTRISGVVNVTIAGTFCCYIRADVLKRMADKGYEPTADMRPVMPVEGKDCHLGIWLTEQGFSVAVRGDVHCEHWVTVPPKGDVMVWRI